MKQLDSHLEQYSGKAALLLKEDSESWEVSWTGKEEAQ